MTTPTPQPEAALAFLRLWRPRGPWVLTALNPERKQSIETRTFDDSDDCVPLIEWLDQYNGSWNIYFNVNPVIAGRLNQNQNAQREDIESLDWLHVDIDPRVGEDIPTEQQRALTSLQEPPDGVPPPTCIIFSGGGYQGFWKLANPLPIGGNVEEAERAKRYNKQLELLFRADNCHNINRIMRLPGTINMPDAKKRRKGRVQALASLVEWQPERAYPITDFRPAEDVQIAVPGSSMGSITLPAPANVTRLDSVDDLDTHAETSREVPQWCKALITQGSDPDHPGRYESRSQALYAACCELVRNGVPDEIIFSVITDPEFAISASVLDKRSGMERYAMRQIGRAREHAIDPLLAELNDKHAVIGNLGGKCRIIEESFDDAIGRTRLIKQSFEDFRNRYMNRQVEAGDDTMPLGHWWLRHRMRRQYETMTFAPGKERPGVYNLWQGFAVDAIPGDCSLYLEHVATNICSGNVEHYEYVMNWLARTVQDPGSPGQCAIVLRGDQGTGKGFFTTHFGALFGRHFLQIANSKHLVGSFNAHLRDCCVLFADEAFYAGDKEHESVLKMLVTESTIPVEGKGIDVEVAANCTHVIMASNHQWVVPSGANERRYLVLDVSSNKIQDSAYFKEIDRQMMSGGREALLHLLLTRDISKFNVRSIPQTDALREQKVLSYTSEEEWFFNKLVDQQLMPDYNRHWETPILKNSLQADYHVYAQRTGQHRRATNTQLGKFLNRACPGIRTVQRLVKSGEWDGPTTKRAYFYEFPSIDLCRDNWDRLYGGPHDWTKLADSVDEVVNDSPF